jgi:hypothetical protein
VNLADLLKKLGIGALVIGLVYVAVVLGSAIWVNTTTKVFLSNTLGWEERTANFLSWVAMFVFTSAGLWAATCILFLHSKNPLHYVAAVLPFAVPWVLDLGFGKPIESVTGVNRLYCNKQPDRTLFCRMVEPGRDGGFDPVTQERLHPSTPKERLAYSRGEKKVPVPERKSDNCGENIVFFDEDGPVVWYYEHGGRIDLFDDSGRHPKYGEPLLPVNKSVVLKVQDACSAAKKAKPALVAQSPIGTVPPTVQPPQAPSSFPVRPAYADYVQREALQAATGASAVVVKGHGDSAQEVIEGLAAQLHRGVFTETFVSRGLFDRAIGGDQSAVAGLELPQGLRRIVLISASQPIRTTVPAAQGAQKVSVAIQVAILDPQSGTTLERARFVAEGMGFTDAHVQSAMKQDLVEKLATVRRSL